MKRIRRFRAWVIADGDYRGGPVDYSRLWAFGARGGAADFIATSLMSENRNWEPVEVRCIPVYPKKRKRAKGRK